MPSKHRHSRLVPVVIWAPDKTIRLVLFIVSRLSSMELGDIFFQDLKKFVRDWKKPDEAPILVVPEAIDSIVRVDYYIAPAYPEWMEKVTHPDLEMDGPSQYDLTTLEEWFHPNQDSIRRGQVIYEYLKTNGLLVKCLGLRDLKGIQHKGIKNFRQHWSGKSVFGWKSVIQDKEGRLYVPFLFNCQGVVGLNWRWIGRNWGKNRPALRFP